MPLEFKLGSEEAPRGHALVYCTDINDPKRVAASYAVHLPLTMDVTRYIPPFMSGLLDKITTDMSALILPPIPQDVPSLDWLIEEAERRGDDLIFAGALSFENPEALMLGFSALMAEYKAYCENRPKVTETAEKTLPQKGGDVDDLIYSLMPEAELLKEATTLLSEARYALEGNDTGAATAAEGRLRSIAKVLPENRLINKLVDFAAENTPTSLELANLYLERAYSLHREEYLKVSELESKIRDLERGESSTT